MFGGLPKSSVLRIEYQSERRAAAGDIDLMKKGLRPKSVKVIPVPFYHAGDIDLMKKGLRPTS